MSDPVKKRAKRAHTGTGTCDNSEPPEKRAHTEVDNNDYTCDEKTCSDIYFSGSKFIFGLK